MSLEKILEDWSEYDNKKLKGTDKMFFSCSEDWEVDYLINKIKKIFPQLEKEDILRSIQSCCSIVKGNKPREEFVDCVLRALTFKNLI